MYIVGGGGGHSLHVKNFEMHVLSIDGAGMAKIYNSESERSLL
jgi:hypothetical protein